LKGKGKGLTAHTDITLGISLLTGAALVFALLAWASDRLHKKIGEVFTFLIVEGLIVALSMAYALYRPIPLSSSVLMVVMVTVFWGLSWTAYDFGLKAADKYYADRYKRVYAYVLGAPVILFCGLGAFVCRLVFTAQSDFYKTLLGTTFLIFFLTIPYWAGVFRRHLILPYTPEPPSPIENDDYRPGNFSWEP
jgi:hypothetical protein